MSVLNLFAYTYDTLNKLPWGAGGFGIVRHNNIYFKQPDGVIAATYRGHSIIEYHPDGTIYLLYNRNAHTSGVLTRWNAVAVHVTFDLKKRTRQSGQQLAALTYKQSQYTNHKLGAPQYQVINTATVLGHSRFKLSKTKAGLLTVTPDEPPHVVVKDNAKYRAFTAQLKQLKAVLTAQIKLGLYQDSADLPKISHPRFPDVSLRSEILTYVAAPDKRYLTYYEIEKFKRDLAYKWLDKRDPALLHPFVLCCLDQHSSDAPVGSTENILRRVMHGIAYVQRHYLRTSCVTISDPTNSSSLSNESDDQDSELLPPARLREVQVPCEAQVC